MQSSLGYLRSAWVTGVIVMAVALISLWLTEETFGKDLNYLEQ